ncbi:MAG: DMP19 family protein [Leeuwenhoekiella sp.]|nr:DMP19 family protein [Leeuwenhoekiella sp.]
MQNLNQVLSLEDNQALILAVGEIITPKIKERDQFDHLNTAEKTFIYLDVFEAALHTGNFESFFINSGQFAHEILEAYRAIGATKTVLLLEQAISRFPDHKVPKNPSARAQVIDQMHESTFEFWDSLFQKLFASGEPVADLLAAYIRDHKDQFTVEPNTGSHV